MILEIRYAKANGKKITCIGDFSYKVEFKRKYKEDTIRETIKSIYDDYKGDPLEHYFEKKANVFCCYLKSGDGTEDKTEIFISDSKEDKKSPIAIIDGLIRRLNIARVEFTNGAFTQTLLSPTVEKDINGKKTENIVAKEYLFKQNVFDDKNKVKLEENGNNIKIFLPYRDSNPKNIPLEYRYNKAVIELCSPFFYFLNGDINVEEKRNEEYEGVYVEGEFTPRIEIIEREYFYSYHILLEKNEITIKNKILWLLKGDIDRGEKNNISKLYYTRKIQNQSVSGLFYSSIYAAERFEGIENLKIIPWYSYSYDKNKAISTISTKLENYVHDRKNTYRKTPKHNVYAERDLFSIINNKICEYGLVLSSGYNFINDGDIQNNIVLTPKQTKNMIAHFPTEDETYMMEEEIVAAIEYGKKLLGLKGDRVPRNKINEFVSNVGKGIVGKKYKITEDDTFRTCVHEIGHALAVRLLLKISPFEVVDSTGEIKANSKGLVKLDKGKLNWNDNIQWFELHILFSIASQVAEMMFYGQVDGEGFMQDNQDANAMIIEILHKYADFYEKQGNLLCYVSTIGEIPADDALDILFSHYTEKLKSLFSDKKDLIRELAGTLLIEKTISGDRLEELYQHYREKQNVKKDINLCERIHLALETAFEYAKEHDDSIILRKILSEKGSILPLDNLKDYFVSDKISEIYSKEISEYSDNISTYEISEDYSKYQLKSEMVYLVAQIAGFNIFDKNDKRGFQQISTKLIDDSGTFGIIVDKKSDRFAVFIDGSDRSGNKNGKKVFTKRGTLKLGKEWRDKEDNLSYENIGYKTNLIYAADNYRNAIEEPGSDTSD